MRGPEAHPRRGAKPPVKIKLPLQKKKKFVLKSSETYAKKILPSNLYEGRGFTGRYLEQGRYFKNIYIFHFLFMNLF